MKAPKNFYNTVDQSKLGIDDLFTRTAENEADITALDDRVEDLEATSEQYHDDIADLKTADITINNRIDGHLLKETTTSADAGKIMSVDSNGDWALTTPAPVIIDGVTASFSASPYTITFSDTIANICNRILSNSTKPVCVHAITDGTYTADHWYHLDYIDHFDNTMYFYCMQVQSTRATFYSFKIKPSDSGNSTTLYSKYIQY